MGRVKFLVVQSLYSSDSKAVCCGYTFTWSREQTRGHQTKIYTRGCKKGGILLQQGVVVLNGHMGYEYPSPEDGRI